MRQANTPACLIFFLQRLLRRFLVADLGCGTWCNPLAISPRQCLSPPALNLPTFAGNLQIYGPRWRNLWLISVVDHYVPTDIAKALRDARAQGKRPLSY